LEGWFIPAIGKAQYFFAERQYVDDQVSMMPSAREGSFTCIFGKAGITKTSRELDVVRIGDVSAITSTSVVPRIGAAGFVPA